MPSCRPAEPALKAASATAKFLSCRWKIVSASAPANADRKRYETKEPKLQELNSKNRHRKGFWNLVLGIWFLRRSRIENGKPRTLGTSLDGRHDLFEPDHRHGPSAWVEGRCREIGE